MQSNERWTKRTFVAWLNNSKDVAVFIDAAGGDAHGGLLLQRIVEAQVQAENSAHGFVRRDGLRWIARRRGDWAARARLTYDQIERVENGLIQKGFIRRATFQAGGTPQMHLAFNWTPFLKALNRIKKRSPHVRKSEVREMRQ